MMTRRALLAALTVAPIAAALRPEPKPILIGWDMAHGTDYTYLALPEREPLIVETFESSPAWMNGGLGLTDEELQREFERIWESGSRELDLVETT